MNTFSEGLERAINKVKIKSWLVFQDEQLSYEYYKNRKIQNNPQKINSCTKSILSILIGIAIDKGFIHSTSDRIIDYFPKLLARQEDIRKNELTIEHLLTMSAGFDWPEFGEWNYFAPMVYSPDIVRYVIDRELKDEPGDKMNYNSGCSHVLTAILQEATGLKAVDFANDYLFKFLGITRFDWIEDNKGINRGADGLRLTPIDMAKIGLLYLNKGTWKSKCLVSSDWVTKSTHPYFLTYEYIGAYGYHWWVRKYYQYEMYFALGYGGQYICIVPELKMVISITSEIYEDTIKPLLLIEEFILKNY